MTPSPWADNLALPSDHLPYAMGLARPAPAHVYSLLTTRYFVSPEWPDMLDVGNLDAYLARRLDLFARFTVPSVAAQTRLPDAWVVLVSAWAADRLDPVVDLLAQVPGAELVVVPDGQGATAGLRQWHEAHAAALEGRTLLAATRLDNDDALAVDFIDLLTKWVALAATGMRTPAIVSLPHGVQFLTDTGDARLDLRTEGHFLTMLTRTRQPFWGPYGVGHTQIYDDTARAPHAHEVVQIWTRQPMWLEVVHDTNLANRPRPGPRLADVAGRFVIHPQEAP